MSDSPSGPGWWLASDGKWYAPDLAGDAGSGSALESSGTQPVFPSAATDDVFSPAAGTAPVFPAVGTTAAFPGTETDSVFPTADSSADVFPGSGTDTGLPSAAGSDSVFPSAGTDSVFPVSADTPTQQPFEYPTIQYPDTPVGPGISKSKVAAGVLAILLGWLGIHRFYLGYNRLGLVMLLISVLSLGALIPITAVWGIVEGILILIGKFKSDKHGVALK